MDEHIYASPQTSATPSRFNENNPNPQNLRQLLFSFNGRIPRSKFWISLLVLIICSMVPIVGLAALATPAILKQREKAEEIQRLQLENLQEFNSSSLELSSSSAHSLAQTAEPSPIFAIIGIIVLLLFLALMALLLWCSIALYVKRYHDLNKSGWWYLLSFVPLIGIWVIVECGFFLGSSGENDYGPDPLDNA